MIGQAPPHIRNDFIKKVYSILTVQLAITFVIAFYINTALTPVTAVKYIGIARICGLVTLGVMLGATCCCSQVARTFPTNYIFLLVVTLGMSVTTGFATVFYSTD